MANCQFYGRDDSNIGSLKDDDDLLGHGPANGRALATAPDNESYDHALVHNANDFVLGTLNS